MSRFALLCAITLLVTSIGGCGSQNAQAHEAATVNGHAIPMSQYDTQVHFKRISESEPYGQPDVCSIKTFDDLCRRLKQSVLDDLINEELVREYAAAHHIAVSQADFNREWTVVFYKRFHENAPVLQLWAKIHGLRVSDVQDFVRQDLLQQMVMYRVTATMSPYAPATRVSRIAVATSKQLRNVQILLRHGDPFNSVASAISGDRASLCARIGCGDLGWLPNVLVPPRESAVTHMRVGSVAGPFASQGGYTLLLVEGHVQRYRMTASQQLGVREQLFASWITRQREKATVQRYVAT